jgi:hypothetical protein
MSIADVNIRFIGVTTATGKYPMQFLHNYHLIERGDRNSLLHNNIDGILKKLAFVWMDRERRYFIYSCSATILHILLQCPCRGYALS